jgi:hypothetical protein
MSIALLLLVLASTSPLPAAPTAAGSETTGRVALGLPSANNSAASIEAEFRESYRVQATQLSDAEFPRECIPFTAFYKAILPLQPQIDDASTDGRNDELYAPVDLLLRFPTDATTPLHATKDITIRRSKHLGDYLVTFRYGYRSEPPVIA